jgi:phasin family protein
MAAAKTAAKITTTFPSFEAPQFAEIATHGKKNLEAYVASVTAAQTGAEKLTERAVAYTKSATEYHVEAAKSLLASKSPQEYVEKQTAYLKSAFEAYVAETKAFQSLFAGIAGRNQAAQHARGRSSGIDPGCSLTLAFARL